MSDFTEAGAKIAATWAHGHDTVVDDCALCAGEMNAIMDWHAAHPTNWNEEQQ